MPISRSIKDLPRSEYLLRLAEMGITEAEHEARMAEQDRERTMLLKRMKGEKPKYPDFPGLSGDLHRAAMAEWRKQNR